MKLLVVSGSPLEKVGSDYWAFDTWIRIPQYLSRHLERVTVLSPVMVHKEGDPPKGAWKIESGNLKIESQDYYNSVAAYYRSWPLRISSLRAQAAQLVGEHDLVVVRSPSPMISLITRCARRYGKPLIVMIMLNIETQTSGAIERPGLKRIFYKTILKLFALRERWCAGQADMVYVYSREIADRHRACGDRVRFMQDPLLLGDGLALREDTCQSEDIRILRICWLIPSKGLEYLIEAVALLAHKGVKVRLEIVGKERSAGYQERLGRLIERFKINGRVAFTGWVPVDQLREVYLRNDIHIISSLGEGTPRVIVEGFAHGLPLVSTAVGGCADILTHEESALLVPPRDPAAITAAVERLIRDGALRRKMIRRGYDMAREATFERWGTRFLNELKEAIGAN